MLFIFLRQLAEGNLEGGLQRKYMDTKFRSIIKAISWRLFATLTTFILAFIIFREDKQVMEKSMMVAGFELVLKLLIYYLHERIWVKVKWGKIIKE